MSQLVATLPSRPCYALLGGYFVPHACRFKFRAAGARILTALLRVHILLATPDKSCVRSACFDECFRYCGTKYARLNLFCYHSMRYIAFLRRGRRMDGYALALKITYAGLVWKTRLDFSLYDRHRSRSQPRYGLSVFARKFKAPIKFLRRRLAYKILIFYWYVLLKLKPLFYPLCYGDPQASHARDILAAFWVKFNGSGRSNRFLPWLLNFICKVHLGARLSGEQIKF